MSAKNFNLISAKTMSGNMNPNASQFSPSALAMVKHDGAEKSSDLEDGPRELIVHESIKQLIQEVQELKIRATNLEEENGHLKQENCDFKRELSSLKKASASGSAAPAVVADLTGYAASECSSTGIPKHPIGVRATDLSCRCRRQWQ